MLTVMDGNLATTSLQRSRRQAHPFASDEDHAAQAGPQYGDNVAFFRRFNVLWSGVAQSGLDLRLNRRRSVQIGNGPVAGNRVEATGRAIYSAAKSLRRLPFYQRWQAGLLWYVIYKVNATAQQTRS